MTARPQTIRRVCAALTALALSWCLASCEMPPTEPTPRLSDVRPSDPPVEADEHPPAQDAPAPDAPVIALIQRIDLPLEVSLDPVWDTVDEQALPMRMHGMWQANGLRIGVLSAQQAQAFADALPRFQGQSQSKLLGSPYPSAIRTTPRLREPVTIDLTDPPMSPLVVSARGGRLQLLAKIGRDDRGRPYLELTPHHYKPKATLLPRSPLEKQLDGRVFDSLTARVSLPIDRALVVGLYRPWPRHKDVNAPPTDKQNPEPASQPPATGSDNNNADPTASTAPADTPDNENPTPDDQVEHTDQAEPKPPAIPDHLGKALMAGTRAGKPIQILLVISIFEEQRPANGNDPR
jgi:hypothetical protein